MARLDFNKLNRPILELVMSDEAETVIVVTTPNEGLVEELETTLPELQGIMSGKDENAVNACYDLAARLISCNVAGLKVTVDDLRNKYWPKETVANMLYLIAFYKTYLDYLGEITNEKN